VRWYDYWRERPGTGKRVSSGGVNIVFSDSNTHHRGAENYRRSGEVDAMRLFKDGYFAHKVMWDGWVNVERPRAHILGHWNYEKGTTKNVYVISSAEQVRLYLNGKSLGVGEQSSRFLFTFKNIEWKPGVLQAVGLDAKGRTVTTDYRRTAGRPDKIKLKVHTGPGGLYADGADIVLVDVEVVDASGNRCPTASNLIDFKLGGAAEWRGGIAQGPENYILSKSLPVENGINRIIIRSQNRSGQILLQASAPGLKGATAVFMSRGPTVIEGLSGRLPGDGLRGYLGRGPTPAGESFTYSRVPLEIVQAEAGDNQTKSAASYDDNETTSWSSSGDVNNAWIKYRLRSEARVSEVVLKLAGWRTQSYPIRILVDDRTVFEGNTPRSLGYVTVSFQPVTGRTVKIQLTGSSSNRDAFGNIIEIPGTPDPNSAAGRTSEKGVLSIVEAEVYSRVN
jgi:beta-galactosidase